MRKYIIYIHINGINTTYKPRSRDISNFVAASASLFPRPRNHDAAPRDREQLDLQP